MARELWLPGPMTEERNDQSAPGTSGSGGSGGANEAVVLAKRGNFPEGLRVVVVDDDPLCLRVVERMLIRCSYIGTHVEFYLHEDTRLQNRGTAIPDIGALSRSRGAQTSFHRIGSTDSAARSRDTLTPQCRPRARIQMKMKFPRTVARLMRSRCSGRVRSPWISF